jgi:hypothetical protein
MAIGTRELGQHEAVKPVRLPARHTEPRTRRLHLPGMQRHHHQAPIKQPLDQHAIRPLDRDQPDLQPDQPRAQRAQPALVMPIPPALHDPPSLIDHAHRVLLTGPIDPGKPTLRHRSRLRTAVNRRRVLS